eukprot:1658596-Pyramimonas_sp.AAC.1
MRTRIAPPLPAQASEHYGDLTIVAHQRRPPAPLLACAAREAFFDLPVSYLKELADMIECDYTDISLSSLLTALAKKLIPGISNAELVNILVRRECSFEVDESLGEVIGLEWVVDTLDKSTSEELHKAIK